MYPAMSAIGLFLCMGIALPGLAQPIEPKPYVLEPGDEIEARFQFTPELNERVQIRPDGRISMPLLGEVVVAGMTVGGLTEQLERRYRDEAKTVNPKITIQVRSYANRKIFVGGEVPRPGVVNLAGKQTVLSALIEAGGLLRTANATRVVLIRRGESGPQMHMVSLKAAKGQFAEAAAYVVEPYDVILVDRSGIAKANLFIDQYIRSMSPALLTAGFNYLYNAGGSSSFVPGVR